MNELFTLFRFRAEMHNIEILFITYIVLAKHKPNLHQTTSMDTDDVEEYNNKYQTYIVQE